MILNNTIHTINEFNPDKFIYTELYFSENSNVRVNNVDISGLIGSKLKIKIKDIELVSGNVFLLGYNNNNKFKKITKNSITSLNDNVLHYSTSDVIILENDTFILI